MARWLKHFELKIGDGRVRLSAKATESIAAEAALDGLYVVRIQPWRILTQHGRRGNRFARLQAPIARSSAPSSQPQDRGPEGSKAGRSHHAANRVQRARVAVHAGVLRGMAPAFLAAQAATVRRRRSGRRGRRHAHLRRGDRRRCRVPPLGKKPAANAPSNGLPRAQLAHHCSATLATISQDSRVRSPKCPAPSRSTVLTRPTALQREALSSSSAFACSNVPSSDTPYAVSHLSRKSPTSSMAGRLWRLTSTRRASDPSGTPAAHEVTVGDPWPGFRRRNRTAESRSWTETP